MQRPWDWISHDPDFSCLKSRPKEFKGFLDAQERKDYPAAIHHDMNAGGTEDTIYVNQRWGEMSLRVIRALAGWPSKL